jgi:ribokinase
MGFVKSSAPAVVVLGDINVDVFARIARFPKPGEDCLVPALELHCGGVGANAALALARWGVCVRLLGRTGRDCFGERALDFLRHARIDVSCVEQTDEAMSGVMFIAVSPDGQRTIFGSRAANAELSTPPACAALLEGAKAAHLMGYNFLTASVAQTAEKLLEAAHRRKALVSLDVGMEPSRQIPDKILQVARKVDILFVSRDEASALTGKQDAFDALEALEACAGGEVVMKLGEQGSLLREDGAPVEVPPLPVTAMDTTGAGDAFAAAFLRARLYGWPRADAALLANAAGAAAASVIGAGEGMPAPAQVRRLLGARLDSRWEPVRVRALERLKEELPLKVSRKTAKGGTHARA